MGRVTRDVPVDHPDFGRSFPCPVCGGSDRAYSRLERQLEVFFGDVRMDGTPKLSQVSLEDFEALSPELKARKECAIGAAHLWASEALITYDAVGLEAPTAGYFEPSPSLIITGETGRGKTCLAGAAYLRREVSGPRLAIEYNDLQRGLFARIDQGDVEEALSAVRRVPLLFVDDVGNSFLGRQETEGRQRFLFEILNFRYTRRLPTLVTSNLPYAALADQFSLKLVERLLEQYVWVEMSGASLRIRYRQEPAR